MYCGARDGGGCRDQTGEQGGAQRHLTALPTSDQDARQLQGVLHHPVGVEGDVRLAIQPRCRARLAVWGGDEGQQQVLTTKLWPAQDEAHLSVQGWWDARAVIHSCITHVSSGATPIPLHHPHQGMSAPAG